MYIYRIGDRIHAVSVRETHIHKCVRERRRAHAKSSRVLSVSLTHT